MSEPALDYLDVEEAREQPGLRLVLTEGVPGPWGQAAMAFFDVKRIPYRAVRQAGGGENEALRAWTGHANAPQAVLDDEPARTNLLDILFLAERLSPHPPLVPDTAEERAEMFGGIDLLAAPEGLGWQRRLQMLHGAIAAGAGESGPVPRLAARYGYSPEAAAGASARVAEILAYLDGRLRAQEERGRPFLVGSRLSALDLVWTAFAVLIRPLGEDVCPMPPMLRQQYTASDESLGGGAPPALLRHRDRIYDEYLELPVRF